MAYDVSRAEVVENLNELKVSLKEGVRTYRVLLNKKTGKIRFAKGITKLERQIAVRKAGKAEDWKEVQILMKPQKIEFRDAKDRPLNSSGIEPLAWRVASETLYILNQISHRNQSIDLTQVHLIEQHGKIEELSGWVGLLNRVDAEKRLESFGIGTYLLREGDTISMAMAFHFSEENGMYVHPYLLTIVESEQKISDLLLLQTTLGWTCYRDDPNLKDGAIYTYFSSPGELIRSIHIARQPLEGV